MKLQIEYLNKHDLKPYANNAKLHPSEQIEQIKKSIEDYGFNDPIAIYGDNEVVEGHGRLLAVMEMDGVYTVPVIRLDHLTDEQRRAYTLVHNKTTMNSGFDEDLLALELDSLPDFDAAFYDFEEIAEELEETEDEMDFSETFQVIVECDTEEEQEDIYERLTKEGYQCKVSTL